MRRRGEPPGAPARAGREACPSTTPPPLGERARIRVPGRTGTSRPRRSPGDRPVSPPSRTVEGRRALTAEEGRTGGRSARMQPGSAGAATRRAGPARSGGRGRPGGEDHVSGPMGGWSSASASPTGPPRGPPGRPRAGRAPPKVLTCSRQAPPSTLGVRAPPGRREATGEEKVPARDGRCRAASMIGPRSASPFGVRYRHHHGRRWTGRAADLAALAWALLARGIQGETEEQAAKSRGHRVFALVRSTDERGQGSGAATVAVHRMNTGRAGVLG